MSRDGSSDRITVSIRPDIVFGFAGDDEIAKGQGRDRISAGSGNDTIHSGPGDDVVAAGRGVEPDRYFAQAVLEAGSVIRRALDGDENFAFNAPDGSTVLMRFYDPETQRFGERSITINLGATAESVFNAQLQTDVSDDGGVLVFI